MVLLKMRQTEVKNNCHNGKIKLTLSKIPLPHSSMKLAPLQTANAVPQDTHGFIRI